MIRLPRPVREDILNWTEGRGESSEVLLILLLAIFGRRRCAADCGAGEGDLIFGDGSLKPRPRKGDTRPLPTVLGLWALEDCGDRSAMIVKLVFLCGRGELILSILETIKLILPY